MNAFARRLFSEVKIKGFIQNKAVFIDGLLNSIKN